MHTNSFNAYTAIAIFLLNPPELKAKVYTPITSPPIHF